MCFVMKKVIMSRQSYVMVWYGCSASWRVALRHAIAYIPTLRLLVKECEVLLSQPLYSVVGEAAGECGLGFAERTSILFAGG